jgi:hypothetical protein
MALNDKTPSRNNPARLLAFGGALAVAVAVLVYFFSAPAVEKVGALAVSATLSGGKGVKAINYRITGNGIEEIKGEVKVTDLAAATPVSVKELPGGPDYLLELTAANDDGSVKCSRRNTFEITAGTTTTLTVTVFCRDMNSIAKFVVARKTAPRLDSAEVTPAPSVEVPPECTECEKTYIASGNCEPDSGCDSLTGEDKQLCLNLLNCMRATNCWVKDPLDCLCGTIDYVECTKHANGDCRAEMQAATKTTDPVKNGTLFYDPSVPAGLANRLISCDKENCSQHCSL